MEDLQRGLEGIKKVLDKYGYAKAQKVRADNNEQFNKWSGFKT